MEKEDGTWLGYMVGFVWGVIVGLILAHYHEIMNQGGAIWMTSR
jgi:hypothetical protein